MAVALERSFRARNQPGAANLVHDDEFARRLGYPGGLVPGVDLYAFMAELPAELWGEPWLSAGSMSARFSRPVFDGEEVRVTASGEGDDVVLELRNPAGEVCATGAAALVHDGRPPSPPAAGTPPSLRGRVPPSELLQGLVLEPLVQTLEGRDLGWPARLGNAILMANCELPPWMHVESRVRHLGLPARGEKVSVSGRVASAWERKGHRFVDLDLAVSGADARPLCGLNHVAIVELAQLR